jgi:hypothetical protein
VEAAANDEEGVAVAAADRRRGVDMLADETPQWKEEQSTMAQGMIRKQ